MSPAAPDLWSAWEYYVLYRNYLYAERKGKIAAPSSLALH